MAHHGITTTEVQGGARALGVASTAVVGLVASASDADAAVFPDNRPVLVTEIDKAIAKAGVQGTLAASLDAISRQASPLVVVVKVPTGADAAATAVNVVGSNAGAQPTGLEALIRAESVLGVKPRIIGAPGLEPATVKAALATAARKLRGMAYARVTAQNVADAVLERANYASRELMLLYPDFVNGAATVYGSAVALGLRARIDQEQGWHKTISNVAVDGVTGLSRPIHFDVEDPASEAGVLNAAEVTALINDRGFRFWGNRTCSDDPLFAFESAVRTTQVLQDTIAQGMAWAIDKPLHPSLAKDILETINGLFRQLKAQGRIVDALAFLDPAKNTKDTLKAGQLHVNYKFTPVPPLESLFFYQEITDEYLAGFADQVG